MARTPTETKNETVDLDQSSTELEEIRRENNQVAAADAVIMGSYDVIKSIGRIETAQFYATVADKLIAETAIAIRESKQYKGLPYKDESGNTRQVAHFEEFCQVFLGKSVRRVQELIGNYKTLGPDLYEQAEKLGFRQRDYNALKALPEDDRKIITLAMEEENFNKALDLMSMMAAKHEAEKTTAKKQQEELKATLAAKDAVIRQKTEELNKKSEQLAKLDIKNQAMPIEARGEEQQRLLDSETLAIVAKITASLNARIGQLFAVFDNDPPSHIRLAAAQAIGRIISSGYALADDFCLQPETNPDTAADEPARRDAKMLEEIMANPNFDAFANVDEETKAAVARVNSYK